MTTFTPGPWTVTQCEDGLFMCHTPGDTICFGDPNHREPDDSANFRLIAAAPDLYEACKEFVRKVESGEAKSKRSYAQMKAALAKADGQNTGYAF